MGHVIPMVGDRHAAVGRLLPWYATGKLDADDRAIVEAHLSGCPRCVAELAAERQLAAGVAGLSCDVDVDADWSAFCGDLDRRALPPPRRRTFAEAVRRLVGGPHDFTGWAAKAMVVLIAGLTGALIARPSTYHALGAPPAVSAGNIIVTFRPDTTEAELRAILNASGARLVGGPTAADAYVLHVPAAQRVAALANLHKHREITVAEPIDPLS